MSAKQRLGVVRRRLSAHERLGVRQYDHNNDQQPATVTTAHVTRITGYTRTTTITTPLHMSLESLGTHVPVTVNVTARKDKQCPSGK